MKKLNYILFTLLAFLFVTSCEEPQDENPVLQTPTTFVLNAPVMQTQYIELTAESVLKLTCSQPDYGYATAAQYYAQVSLTEDFAEFKEINENPYVDCGNIELNGEELAIAMCNLRGIKTKEDYTDEPAREIFVRLRAEIKGVESSVIISNVVKFEKVKGYFALKLPGYIYLIGDVSGGWIAPDAGNAAQLENWRLFEADDAIGSKVYSGTFQVDAGRTFRFYTELTGWELASIGTQVEDNPIAYELVDGVWSGPAVKGKGSFQLSNWEGGLLKMTVDLSKENKYKVTFQAVTE